MTETEEQHLHAVSEFLQTKPAISHFGEAFWAGLVGILASADRTDWDAAFADYLRERMREELAYHKPNPRDYTPELKAEFRQVVAAHMYTLPPAYIERMRVNCGQKVMPGPDPYRRKVIPPELIVREYLVSTGGAFDPRGIVIAQLRGHPVYFDETYGEYAYKNPDNCGYLELCVSGSCYPPGW